MAETAADVVLAKASTHLTHGLRLMISAQSPCPHPAPSLVNTLGHQKFAAVSRAPSENAASVGRYARCQTDQCGAQHSAAHRCCLEDPNLGGTSAAWEMTTAKLGNTTIGGPKYHDHVCKDESRDHKIHQLIKLCRA